MSLFPNVLCILCPVFYVPLELTNTCNFCCGGHSYLIHIISSSYKPVLFWYQLLSIPAWSWYWVPSIQVHRPSLGTGYLQYKCIGQALVLGYLPYLCIDQVLVFGLSIPGHRLDFITCAPIYQTNTGSYQVGEESREV